MSTEQKAVSRYKEFRHSLMLDIDGTFTILKDVLIVSVSFMLFFTAYGGTVNLQSSINAEEGLGTVSLASVFVGFILSILFLPAMLIRWFGTKWTMCLSFLAFVPYIGFQMYPTFNTLIPAGFLMGLGAGPCWCAKCTYIAMAAEAHSALTKVPAGALLQRFLGLFFMFYQLNEIWGNLISSLVLSSGHNTAAVTAVNESMIPELCGANFLPSSHAEAVLRSQPPDKIQLIAGIYLAVMFCAGLLMAVGLNSMKKFEASRKSNATVLSLLVVTVKQLANPDQLLILPLNVYLGLYQSFFMSVFNASFVSCAIGAGSVGFVMMVYGVSDAIGCVITGILVQMFGRKPLYVCAMIIHSMLLLSMIAWRPQVDEYTNMFIIAILWGLCDSVWMVQTNAYYGVLFRGNEAAAFSNFRLWEAFGFIITYVLSPYIRTRYMVYLLFCFLIVGMICYFVVEHRHQFRIPVESQTEVSGDLMASEDRGVAFQTLMKRHLHIYEL